LKYHNSDGNDCSNQDSDEVDVVDEELAIVMNEEANIEACTLSCFVFFLFFFSFFFFFFFFLSYRCAGYETHGLAGYGAVFGGNSSGGKGTKNVELRVAI